MRTVVPVTNYLPLLGGTMAGNIAMGGSKVTGLGTPSAVGDAASKTYVDTRQNMGGYTGDGTSNKTIAHGLGVAPRMVLIVDNTNTTQVPCFFLLDQSGGVIMYISSGATPAKTAGLTAFDATNFYVGNSGSPLATANQNATSYKWVAFA